MNITLEITGIDKLDIRRIIPKSDRIRRRFTISYSVQLVENKSNKFAVTFNIMVYNSSMFRMKIEYSAFFKTSEDIDINFLKSDFARINAPAIAYPFLRSYVSFIALNSGYEPVILPTINFVEFSKENFDE